MPETDVCAGCQITYPEGLLAPYFTDGAYELLCGICALARVNATHGTQFKQFQGELAEAKRQQALAFRYQREIAAKGRP